MKLKGESSGARTYVKNKRDPVSKIESCNILEVSKQRDKRLLFSPVLVLSFICFRFWPTIFEPILSMRSDFRFTERLVEVSRTKGVNVSGV